MDAALRFYIAVEHDYGVAICINTLNAIFLVERRLVIKTTSQSQCKTIVAFRHIANAETWRNERFLIEVPIAVTHAHIEGKGASACVSTICVLNIGCKAVAANVIARRHVVNHVHFIVDVWQGVPCRVTPLPLARTLINHIVTHLESVTDVIVVKSNVSLERHIIDVYLQAVACMFVILAHSQLATNTSLTAGTCLIKPVLAVNVIGHKLIGTVG